jgi:hypothetical protein
MVTGPASVAKVWAGAAAAGKAVARPAATTVARTNFIDRSLGRRIVVFPEVVQPRIAAPGLRVNSGQQNSIRIVSIVAPIS